MFEGHFQLSANRTSVRTEITAGLTTFAAMAYILAVHPAILSVSGMDAGAIITATALASEDVNLSKSDHCHIAVSMSEPTLSSRNSHVSNGSDRKIHILSGLKPQGGTRVARP